MTNTQSNSLTVKPGQWLGMLGGGQLGRMFCHSAQSLGYKVAVLDPDPQSPAGTVADKHFVNQYDDKQALQEMAKLCQAITMEFENVPADSLSLLEDQVTVRPSSFAVSISQNRITEKEYFTKAGVAVAPFAAINSEEDIQNAPDKLFPGIIKTAMFGYDGKGQVRVADREEALQAWHDLQNVECILESQLELLSEVSVVLVRDSSGNIQQYESVQNEHRDGILAISTSHGLLNHPILAQKAFDAASAIAKQLEYIGVLCVEFFVLPDNRLIVNEMAPRPHNSGHYTINGSVTSQFEQQVRMTAGMPIGSTENIQSSIMLNILGDVWFKDGSQDPIEPNWNDVLAVAGAHLHLYGKSSVRKGRKMGHVNITAPSPAKARHAAYQVAAILGIEF